MTGRTTSGLANRQFPVDDTINACNSCTNTIETVLLQTEGVSRVEVRTASAEVDVWYRAHEITPKAIEVTIDDWGYSP